MSDTKLAIVTDELAAATVGAETAATVKSRLAGLAVLGITALVLAFLGRSIYFMVTDSWVAPIHLSRANDAVLQLEMKLSREQAEMARVEAEVKRIDGDLGAIAAAEERLSELRDGSQAPLAWQADVHAEQQKTLARVITSLREEVKVLERVYARQQGLTEAAERDLEARLIERRVLDQHRQTLDGLAVAMAEKKRMLEQARHEELLAGSRTGAYRERLDEPTAAGAGRGGAARGPSGVMPEIAASLEHATRIDLELVRLDAERRNLLALRTIAEETVAKQKELLAELRSRPLHRAMSEATDIAFVPYDQLDGVKPGARVMACTWGLILCDEVGRVSEVLAGEVATQDPWGDLARGQYAVLELSDPDAIRQKVLRIRM